MQVTIRKAHKIRKEIETTLAARRIPVSMTLSGLDTEHVMKPKATVSSERASKTICGINEYLRLSMILSRLRESIGKANLNSSSGVDGLLARMAHIDRCIKMWKQVDAADKADAPELVKAKLLRAKTRSESPENSHYGESSPDIVVSLVDAELREMCTTALYNLKQDREALDDERLTANAREHIEIANDDAVFLKKQRLV